MIRRYQSNVKESRASKCRIHKIGEVSDGVEDGNDGVEKKRCSSLPRCLIPQRISIEIGQYKQVSGEIQDKDKDREEHDEDIREEEGKVIAAALSCIEGCVRIDAFVA